MNLALIVIYLTGCGSAPSGTAGAPGQAGADGTSGQNIESASSGNSSGVYTVKANGTAIGTLMGANYIQNSSNYLFSLGDPVDGVSTTIQVAYQYLYYTTTDCSGTIYIMGSPIYSAGFVFTGYPAANTPTLYYIPKLATFSQMEVKAYKPASGICTTYPSLTYPLMKAVVNDSSKTGVTSMTYPQPITLESGS